MSKISQTICSYLPNISHAHAYSRALMIYELQSALSNVQILVNSLGILNTVYHLALCSALILHEHVCVCVCVCPKEQRRVWMRFTSNDAYSVHCNHFKILVGIEVFSCFTLAFHGGFTGIDNKFISDFTTRGLFVEIQGHSVLEC